MEENKTPAPMDRQKLIKIAVIAIVVAAALFGAYKAISTYRLMVKRVDTAVNYIMTEEPSLVDLDDWWVRYYTEYKDSSRFPKKLNEAISALPAQEDLQPGQVSRVVKNLETLGYHNESTKAAIDAVYAEVKPRLLADDPTYFIRTLRTLASTAYYSNAETILPADEIIALYADARKTAVSSNDINVLVDYIKDVQDILEACPYIRGEDLISTDEILSIVTPLTRPTVFRDGQGGYYDTNDRYSRSSYKDSLHYTHTKSYTFLGDFMIQYSSKRALRTTGGEKWEEDLLREYDSSSTTVYYKGENINVSTQSFQTLLGGGTLITKPVTSNTSNSSGDVAISADAMFGSENGNVLAVLISTEKDNEILCFVKEDGIAFLDPIVAEVSFDKVSTEGFDLSATNENEIFIEKIAPETDGALTAFESSDTYKQMVDIMNDAFKEFSPEIRFDRTNNRIVLLVTAPPGTATAIEQGLSSDAWNQFCQSLAQMSESGHSICTQAGSDIDFIAAVISDTDDNTILYSVCNGEDASVSFIDSQEENVSADASAKS